MTTRSEREKKQLQNERYKLILAKLLAKEDNKYCADCLAKGPRWVSWNLGVLLCIRCSGIHRSLGVHISRVKSVNLDTWTSDQVVKMCSRGNGWAKDKYEAKLPRDFKRPNSDSSMEYFIRDKYEKQKYISSSEVPLRSIEEFNIFEGTESPSSRRREKRKGVSNGIPSNPTRIDKPAGVSVPRPKPTNTTPPTNQQPQFVNGESQPQVAKSSMDDLLGLNSPTVTTAPVNLPDVKAPPSADLTFDLFTSMQAATSSSAAPPEQASATITEPQPNQATNEQKTMSKDSILSLYSQNQPMAMNPYTSTGQYNVPRQAMYAPQQATAGNMGFQNNAYNMQQMQGMMGYQQQNMQAMQQQYQWQQQQQQQQQLQHQMQNMQLGGAINNSLRPSTGMRSHNSMPQMSGQGGYPNQIPSGGMLGFPHQQNGMTSSQPSLVGVDPSIGGWGAGGMNSGQTLSTQLWK